MSESTRIRAIYRTLLRTVGHSVGFHKQDVKNLRRVLRDDFDQILQSGEGIERVEERVSQTMLFHLASSQNMPCKTFPSREAIASRVMLNLSAICYHNLSPNTVMQTRGRTAITGGSDSSVMRKIRSQRNSLRNQKSSKEQDVEENELMMRLNLTNPTEVGDFGAQFVTSLHVPGRRQRGPKYGPPEARRLRPKDWNGQKQDANTRYSFAAIQHLKNSIDELSQMYNTAKDQANQTKDPKEQELSDKLHLQLRSQRSQLRTLSRPFEAQQNLLKMQNTAASILHSVVQKAEGRSGGACLGSARIGKWARGEWLPP